LNKTVVASVAIISALIFGLAWYHLVPVISAETIVAVAEVVVAFILAATVWVEASDFLLLGELGISSYSTKTSSNP